jgi:hypothetical protein
MAEEAAGKAPAEELTAEKPQKRGCLIKGLVTALVLIAVLVIVILVRDGMAQNQADQLLREAEQLVAAIEVPAIPAGENGEELYKQALAGIVGKDSLAGRLQSRLELGTLEIGSAEITKLLADNQAPLALAMQGYRKPRCVFTTDYHLGFAAPVPNLLKTRAVAQMLTFSARRAAAEGRGKQAAEFLAAVFRLSRGISRQRMLISHMIGIVCEDIAIAGVRDILTDGKADEAFLSAMAGVLAAHEKNRPGLLECLKVEESGTMLAAAQFIALKPPKGVAPESSGLRFFRWFGIPFRDARTCEEIWAKVLASAAKPYPQAYEELSAIDADPATVQKLKDLKPPYSFVMMQGNRGSATDAENLALLRAARVAVELYRAQHGNNKYPDSAPASMPIDPFSAKPLLYRKTASGFVVYSVGTNKRQDDGGKNLFGNWREPDVVFAVDAAARKTYLEAMRKKAQQRKKVRRR